MAFGEIIKIIGVWEDGKQEKPKSHAKSGIPNGELWTVCWALSSPRELLYSRFLKIYFQLSTWVAATIVTEKSMEKRANMFINFIETAKVINAILKLK